MIHKSVNINRCFRQATDDPGAGSIADLLQKNNEPIPQRDAMTATGRLRRAKRVNSGRNVRFLPSEIGGMGRQTLRLRKRLPRALVRQPEMKAL